MPDFKEQFRKARNCSIPLVVVRSADSVASIQNSILALNGKGPKTPLIQWDVMRGLTGLNESGKDSVAGMLNGAEASIVSARPTDALGMLEGIPEDSVVFMHNLHLFWSEANVVQGILNLRDRYKGKGALFCGLCLTGSILPAELTEHTLTLDDSLPTSTELAEIVRNIYNDAALPEPDESTVSQACDATMGLSGFAAEQSLSLNLSKTGLDVRGTWDRKRKMIESDGLLKVYHSVASIQNSILALESISRELFEEEKQKQVSKWQSASEEITAVMRQTLAELVSHLKDRLTPGDDGKPKVLRESAVTNLTDFLKTFDLRNVTNDTQLSDLAQQCRSVISGRSADMFRESDNLRRNVSTDLSAIKTQLDALVAEKPSRKFRFDE